MSRRRLYMVGDFLAKQTIHVLFARGSRESGRGYEQVFTCYAEYDYNAQDSDHSLLEQLFEEFNIGETSEVAKAYRAKGLRSLSVGDIIVLDEEVAWQCTPTGWQAFDLTAAVEI